MPWCRGAGQYKGGDLWSNNWPHDWSVVSTTQQWSFSNKSDLINYPAIILVIKEWSSRWRVQRRRGGGDLWSGRGREAESQAGVGSHLILPRHLTSLCYLPPGRTHKSIWTCHMPHWYYYHPHLYNFPFSSLLTLVRLHTFIYITGVNHVVDTDRCFFQLFNKGIKSIQGTKLQHYVVCNSINLI